MTYVNDDDLDLLARDLERTLHGRQGWYEVPQLYGLVAEATGPGCAFLPALDHGAWQRLAIGDPYEFLDDVRVTERDVALVALAVNGWSLPAGHPDWRRGRPSQHPDRVRVRSVVAVTADGRHISVVRQRMPGADLLVTDGAEGPMLRALLSVWWPNRAA